MKKCGYISIFFCILCGIASLPSGMAVFVPPDGGGSGKPIAPTLYAIPSPRTNAQLSWSSVSSATSYKVYRSSAKYGTYIQIASTTSRSYIDYSPTPGTWWYYVKAKNSYGTSSASNKRSIKITPLEILSPQNGNIVAYHSGYYPATYGFDWDTVGTEPVGWISENGGSASTVVSEGDVNHRRVLKCYNDLFFDGFYSISKSFNNQSEGTIEFYIKSSSANAHHFALYSNEDPIIYFKIENQKILVYTLVVIEPDLPQLPYTELAWVEWAHVSIWKYIWYHLKIDFNCGSNLFTLYLNENHENRLIASFLDVDHINKNINKIRFFSEGIDSKGETCWIDAIGFSWDPYYNEGDNLQEGLKLDVNGEGDVSQLTCTINPSISTNIFNSELIDAYIIEIPGDSIVPVPHGRLPSNVFQETYTIKLSGYLPNGELTESETIQITLVGEKIGVFFYNSVDNYCTPENIQVYINTLEGEGFTRFFVFRMSQAPIADLAVVQRYETGLDAIFIDLLAHGYYSSGLSTVDFTIHYDGYAQYPLDSTEFRDFVNGVESQRKAWIVDACTSAGFVWNFEPIDANNPTGWNNPNNHEFLAMSATDEIHVSIGWALIGRAFSNRYFEALGYWSYEDDVGAFNYAKNSIWTIWSEPQIFDNSPYTFFA